MPVRGQVANKIASYPEIDIDLSTVERNIVRFRLKGIPAGHLVEGLTTWEFTCFHPNRMLCEPCFIWTLQTPASNALSNRSAKHCGIWNISLKRTGNSR